jgi:hypothetical protein
MTSKTDDRVPFTLRLQPDLHRALLDSAAAANRSLNAEIIERLQRTLAVEFLTRESLGVVGEERLGHVERLLREGIERAAAAIHERFATMDDVQLREWLAEQARQRS